MPFSVVAATVAKLLAMPAATSGKPAVPPAPSPELAKVLPGQLNRALFDHVRTWAYRRRPHYHDFNA